MEHTRLRGSRLLGVERGGGVYMWGVHNLHKIRIMMSILTKVGWGAAYYPTISI